MITQLNVINIVNEIMFSISLYQDFIIKTNDKRIARISIIDKKNCYHKAIFIEDKLCGIDSDKIIENCGVQQMSLYDKVGNCLFVINEKYMMTFDKTLVKCEIKDENNITKYEGFFNKEGRLKLKDLIKI